ncbi:MAG: hypothetical protein GWN58_35265, partial [Anaerolineae bacterium]|nr:hypothetical protein [Anaerolineae bacterium]
EQVDRFKGDRPEFKGTIALRAERARDAVSAIVKAAKGYDYLILGAPQENWFKRRFFASKPARIAGRVECPVVLVRPKANLIGFGLRRLFKFLRGEGGELDLEIQKELQEGGILRPETEPGTGPGKPRPTLNRVGLIPVGTVGLASVAAMYWGSGGAWTWIGAIGFLIALVLFTSLTVRSIER